ncbi:MAG: CotH kinase family protein [Myxococcota bacterium]
MPLTLMMVLACQEMPGLNPLTNPNPRRGDGEAEPPIRTPDDPTEEAEDAPGAGFPFADHRVFVLDLELPPTSVETLDRGSDYVPGTLRFAGFEAPVGVRTKGSSTYDDLDGKPSLKLHFGALTPGATFLGVERLTLNNMKYDDTMMREAAAYRLFAQMGVPAPLSSHARLSINGTDYGVYSLVETLDENFLGRAFDADPDGNLYDTVFVYSDLTSGGLVNFELQEGDPATAGADLAALVSELDGGNILDVLETRFDLEATLSYLAIDLLSANWDGYSRNTNNYLMYHATLTDRWYFVPWGQDTAFRGDGPLYAGIRSRVTGACRADEACAALLEQRVRDVMVVWEEQDLYGWTEALAAVVVPECTTDPKKGGDCDAEDILDHLGTRVDSVRRDIGP